jgi:hypothetical protein
MGIVPNTDLGKITFYEAHISLWTANALSIGILATDATALASAITAARKAYNDQQTALEAAKAATMNMHNLVAAMHTLGSADIAKIKAYADTTHNPNVYVLANIPAPATPTPVGPPGRPMDFSVALTEEGYVMLSWKCANPTGSQGTVYEVQRKIGSGSFEYLSSSGKKSFTDETLPAGSSGVTYQITAIRSTKRGLPGQFNVNFGVGGGGMFIASTSETHEAGPMKMAA